MNPTRFKRAFLRRIDDYQPFQQVLDLLPDVAFFVIDRQSRFVLQNLRTLECRGVASEEETIGKRGYEYFSEERVAMYLEQNHQVMSTGQPIINAVCPAPQRGSNALIIYSKIPLRDRRGRIIGLVGFHREIRGLHCPAGNLGRVAAAAQSIHQRYAEPLRIGQLAEEAGLSRSQFDRQFLRLFGVTPREYLLRVRIHTACRLLAETDRKTIDIALDAGFYDHSHFSRTFRRIMGTSPLVYRRRHAAERLLARRVPKPR